MPKRAAYATDFQPDWGVPFVTKKSKEELATWDLERLLDYERAWAYAEQQAILNPVGGGWTLPAWRESMKYWKDYKIQVILGGNRSGKSTYASRMAVWAACTIPEARVRAYHVTGDRSIEQQQMIWDAIPQSIKNLPTKKGQNHSITFSQKNGFTDGKCIFPPIAGARKGSEISFHNYSQYQQDAQVAEGFTCHFVWMDEETPQKLFETMTYRIKDFKGRLFLTFTTLQGWTPLIQELLGNKKTLKKRYAPLLKKEIPVLEESVGAYPALINYFWSADNVFIPADEFLQDLSRQPKDVILARAYGIPTKSIGGVFPNFNKEVNVIKRSALPWVKDPTYQVTRYMAIDPAGSKSWFMTWVAIDAAGTWFVYREVPDHDKWALPGSTLEGKPGPAQKGSGRGIRDYVELVRSVEEGEDVYERYIDSRMGAAERQTLEGATTIISELDEADMIVIPAPGVEIETGLQLINSLLAWDESKPLSAMNSPKLYVVEDCVNVIDALSEYTSKGGSNEAWKDPIDTLRYLATANIEFYGDLKPDTSSGRTGCY